MHIGETLSIYDMGGGTLWKGTFIVQSLSNKVTNSSWFWLSCDSKLLLKKDALLDTHTFLNQYKKM